MTTPTEEPTPLHAATCPYCERRVLVYEEPPRCPLCACPFEIRRVDPGAWPGTTLSG
jgi:hypothetical protein